MAKKAEALSAAFARAMAGRTLSRERSHNLQGRELPYVHLPVSVATTRPDGLRCRLRELAQTRRRYGYRRLTVLLQREVWAIKHKRVYLLYRAENLGVRTKKKKRASYARAALPIRTAVKQTAFLDREPRPGRVRQCREDAKRAAGVGILNLKMVQFQGAAQRAAGVGILNLKMVQFQGAAQYASRRTRKQLESIRGASQMARPHRRPRHPSLSLRNCLSLSRVRNGAFDRRPAPDREHARSSGGTTRPEERA